MIQRQQTIWLLLAAVASFLTYRFPFYSGNIVENGTPRFESLDGGSSLFLLILTGLSVILAAIAIFLFRDRKTQFKLAVGGILLSIIILVLYLVEVRKFETGNFALTSLLTIAMLAGFVLAARGIRADDKLIKSLDKLR
jgi:hypothetical protein